jgi:tRNA-splicing ligase RtcB
VIELHEAGPSRWRIDAHGTMRVPGIVFASRDLLPAVANDRALEQVCNVATLPGIVEASYAMPDAHWGYGFPIGGVAATDIDDGGVVRRAASASTSRGVRLSSPISTNTGPGSLADGSASRPSLRGLGRRHLASRP